MILRDNIEKLKEYLIEENGKAVEKQMEEVKGYALAETENYRRASNLEELKQKLEVESILNREMKKSLDIMLLDLKEFDKVKDYLKKEKLKTENLEKKMSEKNKEAVQLKQNHLKLLKSKDNEIELLKGSASESTEEKRLMMQRITEMEKQLQESNALNASLKENNNNLEQNILKIKQKSDADQKDYAMKIKKLQTEISEKNRVNEELKQENNTIISDQGVSRKELDETISQISLHYEEQGKFIQKLLGRSSTSAMTSSESSTPSPVETQLESLQKIKDSMKISTPLKLAKDMVEKLISLSSRPEIHQFANYELQRYEGKLRNYSQIVELNIHNLTVIHKNSNKNIFSDNR